MGSFTFHSNKNKILVFAKKAETNTAHSAVHDKKSETAEDLPF